MSSDPNTNTETEPPPTPPLLSQILNPILVGLLQQSPSEGILLFHPNSNRVAVLRGDPNVLAELLAGRKGPLPATKESVAAMRRVELVDDLGEECSVCLEEFGELVVKEMPCKHRFHGDCIEKWLGLHGTCPVCRYCMPVDESEGKKVGEERAVWFEISFGRDREGEGEGGEDVGRNGSSHVTS